MASCKKDHDIPTGKVFNGGSGGGSTTDSLTISVTANPSEGGTVSGGGKYLKGKTCVVAASANEGYVFSNWTENGTQVSTSVSYSFTVDADRTLVANFSVSTGNNFTITAVASPEYGGVISGSGTYQQGQTCTVTATAEAGYAFVNWTENGNVVSTNASYTFTVNGNRTLLANFTELQPDEYLIQVSANPTEGGTVTGGGTYQEGQSCTVTAVPANGYAFTWWYEMISDEGGGSYVPVSSDANYSFTVNGDCTLQAKFSYIGGGSQEYIDLGLPSGLLWATCNVGAEAPEDYGDYFAWGETQPKSIYNWSTYQYCNGSNNTLTRYCNKSSYGYNGFTDNLTTLLPEDDVATANWGSGWCMPTEEEWQELYQNTTHTWTNLKGVNGRLFIASNGNSLFLPAAGYRDGISLYHVGSYGLYWSSSLGMDFPYHAWSFSFDSGSCGMDYGTRLNGFTVRPIRSAMN